MTDSRVRLMLPFAIFIAILAVSTASIFIRFAQNDGTPSLVIAALRLAFATMLLAPIALTKHIDEIKRFTRTEILLGVFSG
ncbi:MAG: EamA/RhaT family transporter, partial [Planctomycetota bacterium]